MASGGQKQKPNLGYIIIYTPDVEKSVKFYDRAFGYTVRRLDQSHKWGELESGATTLAFTLQHQRETDELSGQVKQPDSSAAERQPLEVCFTYEDVDAAYKRAVENGAVPVSAPEDKPWGQRSGFVRDMDGNVVRIASYVRE